MDRSSLTRSSRLAAATAALALLACDPGKPVMAFSSSGGSGAGSSSGGSTGAGSSGSGSSGAGSSSGASGSSGSAPSGSGGSSGGSSSGGTGGSSSGSSSGGSSSGAGSGGSSGASGPVAMVDAAHVRLLPGSPFHDRQELHRRGFLASLEPDRLLFEYRKLARLSQPPGVTGGYPGWDTGFIRGHLAGHYLSAASRMAAATGDTSFRTRVDYVVAELAKCQAALGEGGYLAAFPSAVFDALEGKPANAEGIVVPYYTVHKIMAGLLDAHRYVGNRQALEVATRMADHFRGRLAALPAATIERIFRTDGGKNPQNEFGAMSDVLSELSAVTGQAKYLETAAIFNRPWFMAPLAAGQDALAGLHANTHIAQAVGIAHTANLSGDDVSLRASETFWRLLSGKHALVLGGNSFHEWLDQPGVEAGPSIDGGAALPATTAETCNSNNMLKLTALLFARSPRIDYADYYERTLYNHILASIAPDTGQMTYFTPTHGHFRTYMNGTFCCTGTGIENTPRYNEAIYFAQGSALWVNLYIPSEVTWDATGLTVRQEGNAAAGERVRLSVVKGPEGATPATLHLRIPSWISGAAVVTVNGAAQGQPAAAGTYVSLARPWRVGDTVALELPAALRLERAKDVPSMVSVFYGPILLAGELGSANMPDDFADKDAHLGLPAAAVPAVAAASSDPAVWLQPVAGSPLVFKAHDAGPASGVVFRPLYDLHHQRYSVYWTLQALP